jgi:transposase
VTENSKKEIPEIKRLDEKIVSLQQLLKSESNSGRQEEISQQIRLIQVEKKETSKKLKSVKNQDIRDFELETPKDIRANAVKQCCDALKTGYSNLANENIKFFKMKFRKKSNKKQGIELSKAQISIREGKIRILPSIFKEENILKIHKRIEKKIQKKKYEINNNVDLIRVNKKDYYLYLLLPTNVMEKKPECSKVGGCDLGIRTFATVYIADKSESISIVEYNYRKELLKKLNEKIDLLKRKKRVRRKCFEKYERRKKNFIDVLHWSFINDILKECDIIYLGDIKSHSIVKGKKNKKLNRETCDLKFYLLKERLMYKANVNNKKVHLVKEHFTTKTCSSCGKVNNSVGSSEVFECKRCNLNTGRDINASKNILMKGFMSE